MANASVGAVRIIDSDGDVVESDGSGRLKVKLDDANIDIGDVSLLLGGTAAEVNNGGVSAQTLRVTLANDSTGVVGHNITGGADGVTVVSSAGTDVVLASSTACKKVDIQAQTDNTGLIAVGFIGVDATEATGTGIILNPGDIYSLEINNLNSIYIDSTVSGDGVRYTYYT